MVFVAGVCTGVLGIFAIALACLIRDTVRTRRYQRDMRLTADILDEECAMMKPPQDKWEV